MSATGEGMGTEHVERSYRWLLRGYPRSWREHREDEVLAVLMEGACEEGRTHPTGSEAWDLLGHGLAQRFDELVSQDHRRRTATVALWSGAALALVSLALGELLPWIAPTWWPVTVTSPADSPRLPPSPGTGAVLYALWVSACVLVVLGRSRVARGLMLGVAVFAASSPLLASFTGTLEPPLYFKAVLALFALLAAGAPVQLPAQRARWAVGAALGLALALGVLARPDRAITFGEPGYAYYRAHELGLGAIGTGLLWAIAPVGGLVLLLATRRSLRAWTGPTLVVGVLWGLFALLAGMGNTAWAGLREALVLGAVAIVLALVWFAGRHAGRSATRRGTSRDGAPDTATGRQVTGAAR